MQGVMAPRVYAATFVLSKGVASFPGPFTPPTFPEAVANKKSVYFTVAELILTSFARSKPHSYKSHTIRSWRL